MKSTTFELLRCLSFQEFFRMELCSTSMAWAAVLDLRVIGNSVKNGESKPAALDTYFQSLQAPRYHPA
jgi:hypothetical protein